MQAPIKQRKPIININIKAIQPPDIPSSLELFDKDCKKELLSIDEEIGSEELHTSPF